MWLLLALAFAGTPTDFVGSWVLDRSASDDADALLAAWGVSWIERQAARSVNPTHVLSVEGDVLTLVIDATVTTRTEHLHLGGVPQTTVARSGAPVTTTTTWDGPVLVTRTESRAPDGGPVVLVTRRSVESGGAVMRLRLELVAADGKVLRADRVFRRSEG